MITVAGDTQSNNFPTTTNAMFRTYNGGTSDVFISRLDPSRTGAAQLVYSTYLGGAGPEEASALSVDAGGVVTIGGNTGSRGFPVTNNAYDSKYGGTFADAFISRVDPSKIGLGQLVYSTYVGGSAFGAEGATDIVVDAYGVVTFVGMTTSADYPTVRGYDSSYNRGLDIVVGCLDPRLRGPAQMVYSTFLGGAGNDTSTSISVDATGIVTVAGWTDSGTYPITKDAYDSTFNGGGDIVVTRLDTRGNRASQLQYSTFLGGTSHDAAQALHVDLNGAVTVVGSTFSTDYPTTSGAYDQTHNGGLQDAVISTIDFSRKGRAQLTYSTLLGGSGRDHAQAFVVGLSGLVTAVGFTTSADYPTTPKAFDTTHNGANDVFVSRLRLFPLGTRRFGNPSPGCKNLPVMRALDDAVAPSARFGFGCAGAPGGRNGTLLVGAGWTKGTPFLGTTVYIDVGRHLVALPVSADAKGEHRLTLPLPTSTKGSQFFAQYFWLDWSCNRQPLSSSDAIAVTVR